LRFAELLLTGCLCFPVYILDFTLQNQDGKTARQLVANHKIEFPEFKDIPDAIDATTPLYAEVKPTSEEKFWYKVMPFVSPQSGLPVLVISSGVWTFSDKLRVTTDRVSLGADAVH